LSVDCFDTLLCRRVPKPVDVHLLVGRRLFDEGLLLSHVGPEGFAKLRRIAEDEARRRTHLAIGSMEVTLGEIYDVLAPAVWTEQPGGLGGEVELAIEQELLFADLEICGLLKRFVDERALPWVVVSDTYFSGEQLRGLIENTLPSSLRPADVVTSSDMRTGKGSHLWETTIERLGVPSGAIVHGGDNVEADVVCALRTGIRAVHLPVCSERFREAEAREGIIGREDSPSKWCDEKLGDGGFTAVRRRATLALPKGDLSPNEAVAWETGASVFGPVFSGFSEWVLERAALLGADRLLFLMREGQLLLEFVERALPTAGPQPTLRTAWVSREAVARASIFDGSDEELLAFLDRLRPPTPSQLTTSFGLGPADLPELELLEQRFELSREPERLAREFVDLVLSREKLVQKIVEVSAQKRAWLMGYLRQVAGPGSGPVCLVDVGWSGSIQESLHTMFVRDGDPIQFHGLYLLAHVGSAARALRGVRLEGYLGTLGTDPFDVAAITGGAEIVELVSTCDEGSLLEIDMDGRPVLGPPAGGEAERRSRNLLQEGARTFHRLWLSTRSRQRPIETAPTGIALLTRVLKRFVSQPNDDEALAFIWWLHEENYGSDGTEQLVPPRFLPTLAHRSAEDLHWAPMSDLHWVGGAAALVDHELTDAIFLMREATVDPGRFSSPRAGIAHLTLYRVNGQAITEELVFVRNRLGLTNIEWRLPVEDVSKIVVQPADHFMVFRPDYFEVDNGNGVGDLGTVFRWTRGEQRAALPVDGIRWISAQVLVAESHSTFSIDLPAPLTSRELRVTLAGAFLASPETADYYLSLDPNAEIKALQEEIEGIYRTKLMRAAALPRKVYARFRRRLITR
jgi:hypothetical protein